MSGHTCHYCKTAPCPPKHLCCAPCWALVPAALGRQLYLAFDPKQCSGRGPRPLPTGRWFITADTCLLAIAERKGARGSVQDPFQFDVAAISKLTRAANYAAHSIDDLSLVPTAYHDEEPLIPSRFIAARLVALEGMALESGLRLVPEYLRVARELSPWPVDLESAGLLPRQYVCPSTRTRLWDLVDVGEAPAQEPT